MATDFILPYAVGVSSDLAFTTGCYRGGKENALKL